MRHRIKRYQKPDEAPEQHDAGKLPTHLPVAVYYRQSSQEQLGNQSTGDQLEDLPTYASSLGWPEGNIVLIDSDAAVSGTLRIDERVGMTRLVQLIEARQIAAVLCQKEDRLFRDDTQIQPNIFVQACKKARVLVITHAGMIYDFTGPSGDMHVKMFRIASEYSAEYLSMQIKHMARMRRRKALDCRWAGGAIAPGYCIDSADRFVVHDQTAKAMQEYFRLFVEVYGCRLFPTYDHIEANGPYLPEPEEVVLPDGCRLPGLRTKSVHRAPNGKRCPPLNSLRELFQNAVYIGHWLTDGQIVAGITMRQL